MTRFNLHKPGQPGCPDCGGNGFVLDFVPYGDTWIPLESVCNCVEELAAEELEAEQAATAAEMAVYD